VNRWPSREAKIRGTKNSYRNARYRCMKPYWSYWDLYGGRGIKFLFTSFEQFVGCVGLRPTPKHSIDRWPNPAGDYEPGNVRWATPKQQNSTRRVKRRKKLHGISYFLSRGWSLPVPPPPSVGGVRPVGRVPPVGGVPGVGRVSCSYIGGGGPSSAVILEVIKTETKHEKSGQKQR
jgi:hypothetical protein